MTGLIAKRYRIDSPLQNGRGVFQALDLQLARTVALKMLPDEFMRDGHVVEQFFREATAAARLAHPNIVRVYDVAQHDGRPHLKTSGGRDPVIVMEYVPGHSLDYFVQNPEPLPSEELKHPLERKIDLITQVCRGLHYGHEQHLVHGSLDPSNIRLTSSGEAKILNFGITPVTSRTPSLFTSPEQCGGASEIDRRSDIFSLGVVLYELFATDVPVKERPDASRLKELTTDCPPAILSIVQQSLAVDPADRFPDCRAMELALRELGGYVSLRKTELGIPSSMPVLPQRSPDDSDRRKAETLLKEAREAQAGGQPAVASLLAFQALTIDPALGDATRIFEQTQETLSGRRKGTPMQAGERTPEEAKFYSVANRPEPPVLSDRLPQRLEESSSRGRGLLGTRFLRLVIPIIGVILVLLGAWFGTRRRESGPAPVVAGEVKPAPNQDDSISGTVSLDVVPWSRVESIVRVNDGRVIELGELETPCVITLPAGRYMVVVSHPDFGKRLFPIDVKSGEVQTVEYSLLSKQELERELYRTR